MPDINHPATNTGTSSAPADSSYHDLNPFTRELFAAAVFRGSSAASRTIPGFYKLSWPIGPALLYAALLAAGAWAAAFLAVLTANNDESAFMSAVPLALFVMEFVGVPLLKFQPYLGKTVAHARAFTATNRKAEDSFHHKARAWVFKEYLVCLLLILSSTVKLGLLMNYGVYLPVALLLGNYAIVAADFAAHMSGCTSKVPFFLLGKLLDSIHRRHRWAQAAAQAEAEGRSELEPLAMSIFPFESEVKITQDGVGGHEVRSLGNGQYEIHGAGTIIDHERDSFCFRTKNFHSRMALARALVGAQLEQLHAPELRPGRAATYEQRPSTVAVPPGGKTVAEI